MPSDERLLRSYSVDDLREILESLRRASSTDFQVEDVIRAEDGDWAVLIHNLQYLALEFTLYSELETRPKYKNYREILKHIAAADFKALPDSVRDRIAPPALHPYLINDFEVVRQNALAIVSKSKRGALKKYARYYFVCELADIYEQFTGRKARKVGKEESGEKSVGKESGEKSRRKLLGRFYNFVLAALKPIDPAACAGIRDIIDDVIDSRREQRELNLPLKLSR